MLDIWLPKVLPHNGCFQVRCSPDLPRAQWMCVWCWLSLQAGLWPQLLLDLPSALQVLHFFLASNCELFHVWVQQETRPRLWDGEALYNVPSYLKNATFLHFWKLEVQPVLFFFNSLQMWLCLQTFMVSSPSAKQHASFEKLNDFNWLRWA